MMGGNDIPGASYGILQQNFPETELDEAAEQVRNLGYAVIGSGYFPSELQSLSDQFNGMQKEYINKYGEKYLRNINEFFTIRSPLTHGGDAFIKLALNTNLLTILKKLISGKFILNQQNGISNPPQQIYEQSAWHRDLPYQHFVTSRPIAINALFCIDDFTSNNGATFVLPASHKTEHFPSLNYIRRNAIQVEAKAGMFILLDCMLFHAGGYNYTQSVRRGVNHVYNIPYFKQQINIPKNISDSTNLSSEERDILGFGYVEAISIKDYLFKRCKII